MKVKACLAALAAVVSALGQPAVQATGDASMVREFAGVRAFTQPSRDAVMGFSLPTQVAEIFVKGGQDVKKGDSLIRGDDAEDQALLRLQQLVVDSDVSVKRARVSMDLAKLEWDKLEQARSKGAATEQEVDRARLAYDGYRLDYDKAMLTQRQEEVQLDRIKARLKHLMLAAPFDGLVDHVKVDVGQSVGDNEKIVRVVKVDPLWIDVPAQMQEAGTLAAKVNDPAWVLVEVAGKARVVVGKIVEVAPVADPASRTRRVRVEVPNASGASQIVAGEPAWVRFTEPTKGAMDKLGAQASAAGTGGGPAR